MQLSCSLQCEDSAVGSESGSANRKLCWERRNPDFWRELWRTKSLFLLSFSSLSFIPPRSWWCSIKHFVTSKNMQDFSGEILTFRGDPPLQDYILQTVKLVGRNSWGPKINNIFPLQPHIPESVPNFIWNCWINDKLSCWKWT